MQTFAKTFLSHVRLIDVRQLVFILINFSFLCRPEAVPILKQKFILQKLSRPHRRVLYQVLEIRQILKEASKRNLMILNLEANMVLFLLWFSYY